MAQNNRKFDKKMVERIPTIRLTDKQKQDLTEAYEIARKTNYLLTPTDFCRDAILDKIDQILGKQEDKDNEN
jgi:hypothetical protein